MRQEEMSLTPRNKRRQRVVVVLLGTVAAILCLRVVGGVVISRIKQAQAVSEIRRLGGIVFFDDDRLDDFDQPEAIRQAVRKAPEAQPPHKDGITRDLFGRVVAVDLRETSVTDTDLSVLLRLPNLEKAALPGSISLRGLELLLDTPVRWVIYCWRGHALGLAGHDGIRMAISFFEKWEHPTPGATRGSASVTGTQGSAESP